MRNPFPAVEIVTLVTSPVLLFLQHQAVVQEKETKLYLIVNPEEARQRPVKKYVGRCDRARFLGSRLMCCAVEEETTAHAW